MPSDPATPTARGTRSCHVAVIGAGAAGLVAARELLREGHSVVVFEQDPDLGGVWRYNPKVEQDRNSQNDISTDDASRGSGDGVHSSMYASLRTNLPRELMGFTDFPFSFPLPDDADVSSSPPADVSRGEEKEGIPAQGREGEVDPRRFPGHREVLRYLRHFSRKYDIEKYVRYNTRVEEVRIVQFQHDPKSVQSGGQEPSSAAPDAGEVPWPKYEVVTTIHMDQGGDKDGDRRPRSQGDEDPTAQHNLKRTEIFNAVMVCNGHYTWPRVPQIEGLATWPGAQLHSHNYRNPDDFRGKVVVLIGAASSGDDLSKEISTVAKSVHMTSRGWNRQNTPEAMPQMWPNLFYHPMVTKACSDGSVEFGEGASAKADVMFFCTGYCYSFPFLKPLAHIFRVEDNRVGPLYKHMFPPLLAPTLSLIGLPWKVVPFPLVELQSKWVAQLLAGTALQGLPSTEEMLADVEDLYAELASKGVPQDYTHCLSLTNMSRGDQFTYDDLLAKLCNYPPLPAWRKEMYELTSRRKRRIPWAYRDTWEDHDAMKAAELDFQRRVSTAVSNSMTAIH